MTPPATTLVLLTATYPFGQVSETFLDAELPILAKRFDRVLVVPSHREADMRRLPAGVVCSLALASVEEASTRRVMLAHAGAILAGYARALAEERRPYAYVRHARTYLHLLARNVSKYEALRHLIEAEKLHDALFYDYWLEDSTLALAWLRRKGVARRAVARAHRFDLYDECWPTGAVPFLACKLEALDRVFAISQHGLDHLRRRFPRHARKTTLARLGVPMPRVVGRPSRPEAERPLLVSCANLLPHKRVAAIPDVLRFLGRPLRWVHFGDGPERARIEREASTLPSSIDFRLAGHLPHEQLLQFYCDNRVDVFLSMSAAEGLPVSIMEAISHGVPVVAAGVYGVPEIVNESTGTLIDVGDPPEQVATAIRDILDGRGPSAEQVAGFCREHFDAETNFERFAEMLQAL